MKKSKIITILVMCLYIFSFSINTLAATVEPATGYKQVINVGGSKNGEGGVSVSKTIEETEIENYFDITLTVTSEQQVSEIIAAQDLAVVVVMDISNTMVEGMSGTDTRYEAALSAANDFIDSFASYSSGTNADRKLGYIAFNTSAHQIFELQTLKSTATATKLKNTVKTNTGKIINDEDYWKKGTRFTNIEAGLKRAQDMLAGTNIQNKYIIILSDGFPTTYIKSGYTGYNPYMKNKDPLPTASNASGNFYNEIHKLPCLHGTDYSNRAAIKARTMANTIKNSGITIFSVGVGLANHKTISYYMNEDKKRINNTGELKFATVDVDKGVTKYEIGNSITDFKNWLKNSVGSGYYYDAESTTQLKNAYKKIFEKVKQLSASTLSTTWVVEDPMGVDGNIENIEFIGLYDENDNNELKDSLAGPNDVASFAGNKITWDLKKSKGTKTTSGEKTTYKYEIKYRVRLKNELESFKLNTEYSTNKTTTLSYVYRLDDGKGTVSAKKSINFPIPSVMGYLGSLTFIKESSFTKKALEGVEFRLSHASDCECHKQRRYPTIADVFKTSDENGTVTFDNIPSGHKYKLKEVRTLADYILDDTTEYDVEVSYGTTTSNIEQNIISNNIKRTNLTINKTVQGNISASGLFDFAIEIYFEDQKLTGEYKYKVNNDSESIINLGSNGIRIGHNDTVVIYDLPVGATYKISENIPDGYYTQYQINTNDIQKGGVATCNQSNNCRLEFDTDNIVKFINHAEFVLPATGNSTTLIMVIIGSLLLVGPVIYIGYLFYKRRWS